MNKYNFVIVIIITLSTICLSQNYSISYDNTLQITKNMNELKFLHFIFYFEPIYSHNILTELYYSITYNEIGTNSMIRWVRLHDGKVVNLDEFNYQWKGPFPGFRGVDYKFYIELSRDNILDDQSQLIVRIYSTNPEMDMKYYNSYYQKQPFEITATYSFLKAFKKPLKVYSAISTLESIVKIALGKTGPPQKFIISTVLQEVIIYTIDKTINKLPIMITIKCNVCGRTEHKMLYDFNDFEYECLTGGCHNKARISFSE